MFKVSDKNIRKIVDFEQVNVSWVSILKNK